MSANEVNKNTSDEFEVEELLDESEVDGEKSAPKNSRTIWIPKVQNMDNYLLKHYKGYILQELNQLLANGDLNAIAGNPVKSERILPGECCFRRFNYWRINRTDFYVCIDLRLEVQIQISSGTDTDFLQTYVELWFSFSKDDEECVFSNIGKIEEKPDYDGCWKLDKYLVPVLRRDEIDKYAEEIWDRYAADAAQDPVLRDPRMLAHRMGLATRKLRLHKQPHIKSVIFFHDGQAEVKPERLSGERSEPSPIKEDVAAMTIVLNDHADSLYDYDLDIYHECIHYEWHYLFYRLQDMHNNDVSQLKMVRKTALRDQDVSNPVSFMEHQARCGSYGLMMPASFMRETISNLYAEAYGNKRKDGTFDHDGRRYDYIARKIANDYMLSKARVRARMIQLGYNAARGALNYVDGRYITPFAFSESEKATNGETYVIDRKTVALLYKKDKVFQELMQSGRFAYVDGHVVYTDCGNVIQTCNGSRLSAWANAHIDRVSLRFSKVYTGNHQYTYTFGQMNSEEALKNSFKFLDVSGSMTIREAERMKNQLMADMPVSFHGALSYIMKGRVTVDELINRIPISRSTLLRLRTEERKRYNLDQIIAICIGLHLPPWLSEILLDKAGLSVKRYGPYGYYGTILDCFYMDSINDVQQFITENGFDPLDLNFDQ